MHQIIALFVLVCGVICLPCAALLLIILIDDTVLCRFHNERSKVSDDCFFCWSIRGVCSQLLPGECEVEMKYGPWRGGDIKTFKSTYLINIGEGQYWKISLCDTETMLFIDFFQR